MKKVLICRELYFSSTEVESKDLLEERMNHTSTDDDLISDIDHATDEFQLVDNFGTS